MAILPVFYDIHQNRWHRSRYAIFCGVLFIGVTFVTFGVSLAVRPQLPFLHIADPPTNARGVSNVIVDQAAGNRQPINFDTAVFATQNKQTKTSTSKRTTKMFGFYVDWDENSMTSLKENIDTIDVLVPEWLHLADGNGNISLDDPIRMEKTLQFIRSKKSNISIVPLINNFSNEMQDWDRDVLKRSIESESSRQNLVRNLLRFVHENKFDGISIDFEDVPKKSQPSLMLFMQELSMEFHKAGLQVSQSIPLEDTSFNLVPNLNLRASAREMELYPLSSCPILKPWNSRD